MAQKLPTIEFEFERDTKNTYRFREKADEEDQMIGILYIQKSAFKGSGPAPSAIKVTVEVVD